MEPAISQNTTETIPEALARMLTHLLAENRTLREDTKRAERNAEQESKQLEHVREELSSAREKYRRSDASPTRERDYAQMERQTESYVKRNQSLYAAYQREHEHADELSAKVKSLEKKLETKIRQLQKDQVKKKTSKK